METYFNGNYFVSIDSNGTKSYRSLRVNEPLVSDFPDSIDLKITNKCSFGCPYCHENSTISGKSFDLEETKKVLDTLPKVGIEIAVGGGDIMEELESTYSLLSWMGLRGFNPRVTINFMDIEKFGINKVDKLLDYSDFIGISISKDIRVDQLLKYSRLSLGSSAIIHVIVGINPISQIDELLNRGLSVLVLGFKFWGRGLSYSAPNIDKWKREFIELIRKKSNYKSEIGFDNLSIEQLGIRDILLEDYWNSSYMGDEFTHSMYIDAVDRVYAPSSRDPFRVSWDDMSLLEFFKKYRKEDK